MVKSLSQEDKFLIYNMYHSGKYWIKEICKQFGISYTTFYQVIEEVEYTIKTNLEKYG